MYSDPSGNVRNTFLGDNHIFSDKLLMSGGGGGGITSSGRAASAKIIENEITYIENKIAYIKNTDPQVVVDAENIAFYKGTVVIKVQVLDDSAFSFGIIFMGPNVTNPELVKHERGHIDQLTELGPWDYSAFVAVPSVVCYWLTEYRILPDSIYHSLPWEYKANEYRQATFTFTAWAETTSDIYWAIAKLISELT